MKKALNCLRQPNVEIKVVDLGLLIPHEDVEIGRVLNLVRSIKRLGALRRPVIIDDRLNLVIDGHHRLKALELLGLKRVSVVVANYSTDIVSISSWMYVGSQTFKNYKQVLAYVELIESVSKRGDGEVVVRLGEQVFRIRVDRLDFYYALKEFGQPDALGLDKVPANHSVCLRSEVCVSLPKLSVEDVHKVVAKGLKLPPRTTLHLTPLKNIKTLIPLKELYER